MKNLDKQKERTDNLIRLIKENPNLEIVPMVDTECIQSDDFGYWMAEWGNARIDKYHCSDERIYFKHHDYEELVEDFIENNHEKYSSLTDVELERLAEKEVDNLEWIKAIVVSINPV